MRKICWPSSYGTGRASLPRVAGCHRIGIRPVLWGLLLWMVWLGVGHAADPFSSRANAGKRVTMDFQEVDLHQVIRFVAEMVGKNYVVAPRVKGKVTVITPSAVTIAEAEKIFASILSVHGLTIIERDGALKIVPEKEGRSESHAAILPEERYPGEKETVVSRLVRVKHVQSGALANTLKPLMHIWGSLTAHLPSNSMIVTDAAVTVERVVTLAEAMDKPPNLAVHRLFPLRNAPVAQLEKLINSVFAEFNSKRLKSDVKVKVYSDNRTNVLVIVAPEEQLREVERLLAYLDRPVRGSEGNLHLYYPKNGKAEIIAKVLNDLINKSQTGAKQTKGGLEPLEFLRQVSVVGEKESNTLVIAATPEDYETLLPILKGLDLRRLQVHVEALIIEVSAERSAEFGVEWGLTGVPAEGSSTLKGFGGSSFGNVGTSGNPLALGGLAVGLLRGNAAINATTGTLVPGLAALVRAVQGDADVNVLATPNIITMENEEAEIVSGKNVPILTGTLGTTQAANTTTTYDRKNVGLTLRITPQVVEGGWLRLKIFQEQSSLAPSGDLGPNAPQGSIVTKNRSIQTVVTLKSGHMVVLGGLINEERTGQVQQVPCLGGIFGLGELFKSTSQKQNKTNLMVFINPTIINTYSDLLEISERKYRESRTFRERDLKKGSRFIPAMEVNKLPPFPNPIPREREPEEAEAPLRFKPVSPTP